MDHSLLRLWLGLPPGPWPPDHYTLLGLAPGRGDPAAIEPLVLSRMDRLRPHQLLHPELVTEGMNRLAQALICLTDPVARAAHDAELGLDAATIWNTSDRAKSEPDFLLLLRDLGEPTQATEVAFSPGLAPPERLPYEVVEPNESEPPPLPYELVPYEVVETPVGLPLPPAYEVVEAELVKLPAVPWQPANRRQLYVRLVVLRRLLAAWRKLKPGLADPREPFDRPIRVVLFIEAATLVRSLLDSHRGLLVESGALVAVLLRQPHMLATLRTLLPDQRRAVAIDWQRTELWLEREQVRLRKVARSQGRRRKRIGGRWRGLGWVSRSPEVVLVVLAGAVVLVALVRWVGRM